MNVIEEMALYGTPEQKAAAAEWDKHRGEPVTVFQRIHAELCDPSSKLYKALEEADARRFRAYSECMHRS